MEWCYAQRKHNNLHEVGHALWAGLRQRLYNAVADNLATPFRFICLTDDINGISTQVECHPIPDFNWTPEDYRFGGSPKLSVFAPDLYGLHGRAIFMDLDTVITGDLAPMFEARGI